MSSSTIEINFNNKMETMDKSKNSNLEEKETAIAPKVSKFIFPAYMPVVIQTQFPDEIKQRYDIIKDLWDDVVAQDEYADKVRARKFYFLVKDRTSGVEHFMKILYHAKGCSHLTNEEKVYCMIKSANHPNIAECKEVYYGTQFNVIILKKYKQDLFSYAANIESGFIPNDVVAKIFLGTLSAINFLHENKIIYCDLKAENIMLDDNLNPVLVDFELCYINPTKDFTRTLTRFGTRGYISPELTFDNIICYKTDVWGLGIILYILTTLHPPTTLEGSPDGIRMRLGRRRDLWYQSVKIYPLVNPDENLVDIIYKMLEVNHIKRLSIKEIYDHSWTKSKLAVA